MYLGVDDDILRAALEESIRMGPESRRPAADRFGERCPSLAAEQRSEALSVAKEAIATAEQLARQHVAGRMTQAQVLTALEQRYPWLRTPKRVVGGPWWRRMIARWSQPEAELVHRLGHFGFYLVIM